MLTCKKQVMYELGVKETFQFFNQKIFLQMRPWRHISDHANCDENIS